MNVEMKCYEMHHAYTHKYVCRQTQVLSGHPHKNNILRGHMKVIQWGELASTYFLLACKQTLSGARVGGGRKRESLLEYLHRKFRCKMLIFGRE